MRSYFRRWKSYSFKHTWLNPLILVCVTLLLYAINPTESNPLHKAIFLSYPLPQNDPLIPYHVAKDLSAPTYYGKGLADIFFVSFYIVVLSFTREFSMQRLIRPLAIRCGIRSRAKQFRFMEQMYTAMYFAVSSPLGLYVMSRTPVWYFNTDGMYEGFPHRSHEGLLKAYYLLQASYWAQQAIVLLLQLEAPRKDFKELVGHHIITLALIGLSYRFHFTYMGVAVYITHDISDFFLAVSRFFPSQASQEFSNVVGTANILTFAPFRHPNPSTTSTLLSQSLTSPSSSESGSISGIMLISQSSTLSSPPLLPSARSSSIGRPSSINVD